MMKFVYGFLIFTLAYASEKTELQLRSNLEIGSAVPLMLEDLVESSKVPADLLNIEVPFSGSKITRTEVLDWLKSNRTERREMASYLFRIPDAITVEKNGQLSKDQISRRAINRLLQKCADCDFTIQVKNIPQITGDKNVIVWRELPLAGPFMVSVSNPEGSNKAWISGQIKTERKIVKANRALRPGDTIQAEDLKLEPVDISYNKDYFTDTKQLIGRKVARVISTQSVLSSLDIQRTYDVKQGQTVKVISGNEVFEVTLQAVAQESGVIGDTVRIRNVTNQKVMSGRILEKGLVRIE